MTDLLAYQLGSLPSLALLAVTEVALAALLYGICRLLRRLKAKAYWRAAIAAQILLFSIQLLVAFIGLELTSPGSRIQHLYIGFSVVFALCVLDAAAVTFNSDPAPATEF